MNRSELTRITLEEYIEANGGILSFLEGVASFAKEHGFAWDRYLQNMMTDVEYRASFYQRMGLNQ